MSDFKEYYQRVINKDQTGFKLILGGTGLGKTSSAIKVIADESNTNRKFIYIANRLQLLNEFAEKLDKKNISYSHQKSNYEIVKSLQISEIENLQQSPVINSYTSYLIRQKKVFTRNTLTEAHKFIKDNQAFNKTEEGKEILRSKASEFMRFLKLIINTAYKVKTGKITDSQLSPNSYDNLLKDEIVQRIFPYIPFLHNLEEDRKQVLLITIQKAFQGVFDGQKTINLNKFKNTTGDNHFIILLDEFDFLETDLLDLIVNDIGVDFPFDFVARFYNRLNKYKLPHSRFLEKHREYREEIEDIINDVKLLSEKYSISYPEINHFICNDESLQNVAIFQTRNSISNKPVFLDENSDRSNTFSLKLDRENANIFILLNVINKATSRIVRIFKELEVKDPVLYKELLYHCFKDADNFKRIIRQTKQVPYRWVQTTTDDSKLYFNGFGLYEIHSLLYESDYEEVELRYFSIFSTPEKILFQLCKNNLVFGLSATANFRRYVKNFDTYWLESVLEDNYYKIDDVDLDVIRQLNQEKKSERSNSLLVNKVGDISSYPTNSLMYKINRWIEGMANNDVLNIFEKGEKKRHRANRVRHFFNTLSWMLNERKDKIKTDTHLLFYNSFRQIEAILENYKEVEDEDINELQVEGKGGDLLFKYYEVSLDAQPFIVILYNAEKAKEIQSTDKSLEEYFKLFWEEKPVILVTTFPSAGNGVNLQYYSSEDKYKDSKSEPDKDFQGIHLLDTPYYFFSPIKPNHQTIQEQNAIIKANIYRLSKLQKSDILSRGRFTSFLSNIRNSYLFNNFYRNTDDALLNQIAVFIQAIGRIERVWESMENQVICMTVEIYGLFESFLQHSDYQKAEPFFSHNLLQLFQAVDKDLIKQRVKLDISTDDINALNEKCRNNLKSMLADHEKLRKDVFKNDRSKAKEIRSQWENLRRLALEHAFYETDDEAPDSLLYESSAIFETEYYDYINKGIWINGDKEIAPHHLVNSTYKLWNLDAIYRIIREHKVVRGHFEHQHYQLGFKGKSKYFGPYFYQSILVGAIGEEVVKAVFHKHIPLNEDEIPDSLFEVADTKIEGKAWYIDSKNYSEYTVANFSISESDPLYHPKLNDSYFKKRALEKLQLIKATYPDEDCKLIYINVFGNDSPKRYLDGNFENVHNDFDKAEIIIIQGVINRTEKNEYCQDFESFFQHLKNQFSSDD